MEVLSKSIEILIAFAMILWGGMCVMVGVGTYGLGRSRVMFNQHVGQPKSLLMAWGGLIMVNGLAAALAVFEVLGLGAYHYHLVWLGLLWISIHFISGYARLEDNLSITMLRSRNPDRGNVSRLIGVLLALGSFGLLLASFQPATEQPAWKLAVLNLLAALSLDWVVGLLISKPLIRYEQSVGAILGLVFFGALVLFSQVQPFQPTVPPSPEPTMAVTPESTLTPDNNGCVGAKEVSIEVSQQAVRAGDQIVLSIILPPSDSPLAAIWTAQYGALAETGLIYGNENKYTAPAFTVIDVLSVKLTDSSGKVVACGQRNLQIVK